MNTKNTIKCLYLIHKLHKVGLDAKIVDGELHITHRLLNPEYLLCIHPVYGEEAFNFNWIVKYYIDTLAEYIDAVIHKDINKNIP